MIFLCFVFNQKSRIIVLSNSTDFILIATVQCFEIFRYFGIYVYILLDCTLVVYRMCNIYLFIYLSIKSCFCCRTEQIFVRYLFVIMHVCLYYGLAFNPDCLFQRLASLLIYKEMFVFGVCICVMCFDDCWSNCVFMGLFVQ